MAQYRLKPVIVEAVPFADVLAAVRGNWTNLPAWFVAAWDRNEITFRPNGIIINNDGGATVANDGDYIVCLEGVIYPCKPTLFEAVYESVHA